MNEQIDSIQRFKKKKPDLICVKKGIWKNGNQCQLEKEFDQKS